MEAAYKWNWSWLETTCIHRNDDGKVCETLLNSPKSVYGGNKVTEISASLSRRNGEFPKCDELSIKLLKSHQL